MDNHQDTLRVLCKEPGCGKEEDPSRWSRQVQDELVGLQLCFTCCYWMKHVEHAAAPDSVRVSGRHFVICPENVHPLDKGFNGQRFVVLFDDGRRVETTNLWSQGEIPERFRARLPDNARFEGRP